MAAMEEATRKVGTIPAHVPVGDAGWLPPNSHAASGLQLPLAM